jgi:hypothetical protein
VPTTVQTTNGIIAADSITTGGVPKRFELGTHDQGQTVVSDITSSAKEQARLCLLTQCITREVFPYYKFILLDSELNFGGRLQKRVCSKLVNAIHDRSGYWEMNRKRVCTKLTRKSNNVTEAVHKKMTGTSMVERYLCQNINRRITNTCTSCQLYIEKNNLKLLESVKMLRREPENYIWMLDNIVPLIVGKPLWTNKGLGAKRNWRGMGPTVRQWKITMG